MNRYNIVAIRIEQRNKKAAEAQEILTKYGHIIKTRLGLHDIEGSESTNDGLLVLQICGNAEEHQQLLEDLNSIECVKAKMIDLN